MKFLVDMNLSPDWVHFLAVEGFEAVHWSDVGARGASDEELIAWAGERDFVVLTADLDFGAILASTRRHRPSVVQIRSDLLLPRAIGKIVLASIRTVQKGLIDGALVSIEPT